MAGAAQEDEAGREIPLTAHQHRAVELGTNLGKTCSRDSPGRGQSLAEFHPDGAEHGCSKQPFPASPSSPLQAAVADLKEQTAAISSAWVLLYFCCPRLTLSWVFWEPLAG